MNKPLEKSTKAQILAAYDVLLEERNSLENKVKQLEQQLQAKPTVVPSKDTPQQTTRQTLAGDKMTAAIETLSILHTGFGGAISELSEKLTFKASQLQDLRHSVEQEIHNLEDLHDLEELDHQTLQVLIQTYRENKQAFEAELSQKQVTLEQELQALNQGWQQEKEAHERAIADRNEADKKTHQREAQEYKYNLELSRSLDQTQYEQTQKALYKQLEEAKQAQEKQWAERENKIATQEQIYADLKAKVDTFEQHKAAAIKAAIAEAKKQAEYQAQVTSDLRSKELEGAQSVYDLRIQSLQQTIQTQDDQLQSLSKQLNAALKQVQDLAVKAIEGSSNIQSYQAFKEIALEQAKTQIKGH